MKPLLVLLLAFVIALFAIKGLSGDYAVAFAGRIALSVMLLFTAIAHFAFKKGMAMMIPDLIPYKELLVLVTGLMEIAAAIGLQIASLQLITAWLLIVFFILMLPANINAAVKKIDYQKGDNTGSGAGYLWFRVPLQIVFIVWTYMSCIGFINY